MTTVRDYLRQKLRAFGVTDAQLFDAWLTTGIELDTLLEDVDAELLGKALVKSLEELILAPMQSSVNESGFSVSWDFSRLAAYYRWLCKRWGITPDDDVLEAAGLSIIKDGTNLW